MSVYAGQNCYIGGQPADNGTPGVVCCTEVGFFAERFNSSQTISTGVETKINCDTVLWDFRGDFDLVNDWFLVPFEGRYVYTASLDFTTAAAGLVEIRIYQNATLRTNTNVYAPFAATMKVGCSCVIWNQVGDTMDFRIFQTTGFSGTLVSCNNQFSGALIYDNS